MTDVPKYPDVSPNVQSVNALNAVYNNALNSSPQSEFDSLSSGRDSARGLLSDSKGFEKGLSYGSGTAMSDAIRSKYLSPYEREMKAQDSNLKIEANNRNFDRLQKAASLVAQEQALNHQKAIAKYKAKLAKQQARSAMIGQVLGIGGAVAGGLMGGPMGAAAGYNLGSGASGLASSGGA